MRHRIAFTLIELLVVITIIVILLAILTPAVDRAIYQAELAVCMTNLHGIHIGAQSYAMEHKRYYPKRDIAGGGEEIMQIAAPHPLDTRASSQFDLRPAIRGYIELKALVDPLTAK